MLTFESVKIQHCKDHHFFPTNLHALCNFDQIPGGLVLQFDKMISKVTWQNKGHRQRTVKGDRKVAWCVSACCANMSEFRSQHPRRKSGTDAHTISPSAVLG